MACLFKTLQGNTENDELPVFGQLRIQIEPGRTYLYLDGINNTDVSIAGDGHFENASGTVVPFKRGTSLYINTQSGCVLVINNKYAISFLQLTVNDSDRKALNNVEILESLPSLTNITLISTFYGDVTNIKSLQKVDTYVSVSGSGPLTVDFHKLALFNAYQLNFRSQDDNVINVDAGIDEVTTPKLETLQLNGAYSYGTTRNDSSYKVLRFITLVLDNEESVANYILSLANCVPGRTLGAITVKCRTAISSGFRSRTDIRNAVWNLMYNMFANLGDTERTPGTYYTKVTVENVDVSPLQPE